ncbi:hypothetical protein M3Y99_01739700 [Aphelenchoides fujianensis]|nr:hypothetical protein M3Y99_01739700 [Aphelenchoides fujianensis]
MRSFVVVLVLSLMFVGPTAGLTCYQCASSDPSCTATCTNALSCSYQMNLPLTANTPATTRCEMSVGGAGCIGDLINQTITCYCLTDYCNRSINSTLTQGGGGTAAPTFVATFSTPAMGRKKREAGASSTPPTPRSAPVLPQANDKGPLLPPIKPKN